MRLSRAVGLGIFIACALGIVVLLAAMFINVARGT